VNAMSKRTRSSTKAAPVKKAVPVKKTKANIKVDLTENEDIVPIVEKFRTFDSQGWLEGKPELENWLACKNVEIHANSCSVLDYEIKTIRAALKVSKGVHYYEVRLTEGTSVKLGWALDTFKPREYDGVGCDADSWGWDCSRQKIYHNTPGSGQNHYNSWSNSDTGKTYGEYCSAGDIIGCLINFEEKIISYSRNKSDLGVAFRLTSLKQGGLFHPCISLSSRTKIQAMFGPNFSFNPKHVFGLNTTVKTSQANSIIDVFQKYQQMGIENKDSQSFDLMKQKGVLQLASDLGCKDEMDPHLLILAWKMRSRKFCEFYDHEWNVMWALATAYKFQEMQDSVKKWIKEVVDDELCYNSFYFFVFDYLLSEKGGKATALEKNDAINAWTMLQALLKKKWGLFSHWIDYWKKNDAKGVNRDCWKMLISFMENNKNVKDPANVNFDENDMWPTAIEDFVYFLREL